MSAACTAISSNVSEILLISSLIHSTSFPSVMNVWTCRSHKIPSLNEWVSEKCEQIALCQWTHFFFIMSTESSLFIVCLFLFLFTRTVYVSTVTINIYLFLFFPLSHNHVSIYCVLCIAASFVHTIYLIWLEIAFNILPTSAHSQFIHFMPLIQPDTAIKYLASLFIWHPLWRRLFHHLSTWWVNLTHFLPLSCEHFSFTCFLLQITHRWKLNE